jgi:hypothetical protein
VRFARSEAGGSNGSGVRRVSSAVRVSFPVPVGASVRWRRRRRREPRRDLDSTSRSTSTATITDETSAIRIQSLGPSWRLCLRLVGAAGAVAACFGLAAGGLAGPLARWCGFVVGALAGAVAECFGAGLDCLAAALELLRDVVAVCDSVWVPSGNWLVSDFGGGLAEAGAATMSVVAAALAAVRLIGSSPACRPASACRA